MNVIRTKSKVYFFCFDRIIITGTIPRFCYAGGMTGFLNEKGFRIFDYTSFAESLRNILRDNAERIANENGLEIEFIRKKNFRKEARIKKILETRGEFNIRGFQNRNLRQKIKSKTSSQISRIIKRLRVHGLIRKIPCTYKYHLTKLGKRVISLGLKIKENVVIRELKLQRVG